MATASTVDTSLILNEDDLKKSKDLAARGWAILQGDLTRLTTIDNYVRGIQQGPYAPRGANAEYTLLAKRAISNWLPLVLNAPAQSIFAEGYREAAAQSANNTSTGLPDPNSLWSIWQRNRLDSRQAAIYRAALQSGVSYVAVQKPGVMPAGKKASTRLPYDYPRASALSPLRTVALYYDPANDDRPAVVITVDKFPAGSNDGRGRMWDNVNEYALDIKSDGSISGLKGVPHGFAECPVIAFTAFRDLEGRTTGVVEHLLPIQDRINQTLFDLLVAQTYGSFKVRYATGMVPPPKRMKVEIKVGDVRHLLTPDHIQYAAPDDAIYGYRMEVVLDESGNAIPADVSADIARFLIAEDPDTKFGQLDETPLNGFIESISMSVHHMAAIAQVPPHHLLGDMANLSADALAVAEGSLTRMVSEFQHSFGESWEQVMGLFAEATGKQVDYNAEIMWRDMSPRSFGAVVDGLTKLATSLSIPHRGLWPMIPGVTAGTLDLWNQLKDEEIQNYEGNPTQGLTKAISNFGQATASGASTAPKAAQASASAVNRPSPGNGNGNGATPAPTPTPTPTPRTGMSASGN